MEICLWLDWLIFYISAKVCPPRLSSYLLCLPSPALQWEKGKSLRWISGRWLELSQWTPVDPGCQMCLSIGVNSAICLSGSWGFVAADRRCGGARRAECCHSYCLFLSPSPSAECWCWSLMSAPFLCSTEIKPSSDAPLTGDSQWLTWWGNHKHWLSLRPSTRPTLMYVSLRSNRVNKCI